MDIHFCCSSLFGSLCLVDGPWISYAAVIVGKCLQWHLHLYFTHMYISTQMLYCSIVGSKAANKQNKDGNEIHLWILVKKLNLSYFKCIISFVCENTASFHLQWSKLCLVLNWKLTVLNRVSKYLKKCCSCTAFCWWWTLTETGIHEFWKKWSLTAFCI